MAPHARMHFVHFSCFFKYMGICSVDAWEDVTSSAVSYLVEFKNVICTVRIVQGWDASVDFRGACPVIKTYYKLWNVCFLDSTILLLTVVAFLSILNIFWVLWQFCFPSCLISLIFQWCIFGVLPLGMHCFGVWRMILQSFLHVFSRALFWRLN